MALSNAARLSDFGSGIGTAGAVIQVDNSNARLGVGTTAPSQTLDVAGIITARTGFNIGINSVGVAITETVKTLNFVGTGNTFISRSGGTIDISISGGSGGGGIGTAIKYSDETTDSPFSYIEPSAIVEENLDLNTTNAGVTSTYIVSVIPTVQVISGVAVTVGVGKTMVIDVLQIGDL